jgi:hypothetical protein
MKHMRQGDRRLSVASRYILMGIAMQDECLPAECHRPRQSPGDRRRACPGYEQQRRILCRQCRHDTQWLNVRAWDRVIAEIRSAEMRASEAKRDRITVTRLFQSAPASPNDRFNDPTNPS